MAYRLKSRITWMLTPRELPSSDADDPRLVRHWWYETTLTRARWGAVPAFLLLIPFFPAIPWPSLALLALGIGLGNTGLHWLLHHGSSQQRLHAVRWLAPVLDWTGGIGTLAAFSEEPAFGIAPILLLLVARTAVGFRRLFVLAAATTGALLVLGALLLAQVHWFGVLEANTAKGVLITRGALLGVATLALAGWIKADERWRRWEEIRQDAARVAEHAELETYRRQDYGLSKREWELLPLLARDDLTYEQIGEQLSISPYTVKTHVQRIGKKMGVSGRRAVVHAVRERGLLPIDEPIGTDESVSEPSGTEIHPFK